VPPEPFASRFAGQPYLGEVAATDAALEPLLRPLLAAGSRGRPLVVLTGDHGESLGEHGERTHGIFAYEPTLHVPLIVHAPRLLRPRVVEARVQHVDLMPTVLDAVALRDRGGFPGAAFVVGLKPEWHAGSSLNGPLTGKASVGGMHGHLPDLPDLRASFFLIGPGVPASRSLGLIDMRDIATTLARRLDLALPSAEGKVLLP